MRAVRGTIKMFNLNRISNDDYRKTNRDDYGQEFKKVLPKLNWGLRLNHPSIRKTDGIARGST